MRRDDVGSDEIDAYLDDLSGKNATTIVIILRTDFF
jgi:hypothetical protein